MAKLKKDISKVILDFIQVNPICSSKDIHIGLREAIAYATLKRILQKLLAENLIITRGQGKGTKYTISASYGLLYSINADEYFKKEIDKREVKTHFNHSLIKDTLSKVSLFTDKEIKYLIELQSKYRQNIAKLSKSEYKKEMERLAIDLSWKSSQIEGNTYTLLETERLLKEQKSTSGKTKAEATMLLNHKQALDFIIAHPSFVKMLKVSVIEDIHSILIEHLDIERNVRKHGVGITGTNYKPLDNEFQIKEALAELCVLVNKQKNVFAKTLLVLVLISYIQPFIDGNKRTARIISNAILMNNNYCPISFRTVDSIDYKKAMLIFYEQNNISVFKNIFIEQFEFAVKTYF